MLDDWTTALAKEVGIELTVDVQALLAVARDAAHHVARPAAPSTTFLVGYAAASHGGGEAFPDRARTPRTATVLRLHRPHRLRQPRAASPGGPERP